MLSSSHRGDFEPNQCSQRSSGGSCETGCGLASFFLFRFRGVGMSCVVPRCCVVRRDASDLSACLHPAHFLAECCGREVDGSVDCRCCVERPAVVVLSGRCLYGQRSRDERRDRGGSPATVSALQVGGPELEEGILRESVLRAHACAKRLPAQAGESKKVGRAAVPTMGAAFALLSSVCSLCCQWEQEWAWRSMAQRVSIVETGRSALVSSFLRRRLLALPFRRWIGCWHPWGCQQRSVLVLCALRLRALPSASLPLCELPVLQ